MRTLQRYAAKVTVKFGKNNFMNTLIRPDMTEQEAIQEIAEINSMSLETVCRLYNVDTRNEAVLGVLEAIDTPGGQEWDYTDAELEAERACLCASQGLARYC